ncbi:MAG: hypothetical protein M3Y87_18100 [Myxococcota bacterium]|nr:hypothetical protein [Myxococcota bacterium]
MLAALAAATGVACSCGGERPEAREPRAVREEVRETRETRTVTAPAPAVAPSVVVHRELGTLPSELEGLQWPAAPRIEREVRATCERASDCAATVQRAIDVAGTRVRVAGRVDEPVGVHASDVEILIEQGGRLERIVIDPGVQRVRIAGGEVGSIELLPPARWDPDATYDEALFVTDVTLEDLRIEASDSAFVIRGRRVAVLGCDVTAERYSLWAGDTGPLDGEDLIIADNTFRSAGPESTLRMHDVRRSVVVRNVLSNGNKHDYRVHGRGDLAYASHNVLLRTGIMIGTQPGDRVGTVIFEDNVLYQEMPSMLEIDFPAIRRLVLRNNTVYTDRWDSFYPYPRVGDGWTVEGNRRFPFRAYQPPG